jgi:ComF family protein
LGDLSQFKSFWKDSVFVCGEYFLLKDFVHRAKFEGEFAIATEFANLIISKVLPLPDLITAVPPDPKRFNQRGYHLPYKIAQRLAQKLELTFEEIASKTKHTQTQVGLNKQERVDNLKQVFEAKKTHAKIIWLIDDVVTTGTTLTQVKKAILQKNPNARIIKIVITSS